MTITSSPVDEHTDSGIENREEEEDQRSTSPGHSASSSSEISPRSKSAVSPHASKRDQFFVDRSVDYVKNPCLPICWL